MGQIGTVLWNSIVGITHGFLKIIFGIFHKELTQEAEDGFLQFVKFGLVGVSNTAVSYIVYVGSLVMLRQMQLWADWDYLVATGIGFVLSVLWSFYWNNKFVFTVKEGEQRSLLKALCKTYVSYSFTGLFLNSILMVLWVQVLHVSEFLGPILNLLLSVPINFLMNKFWAFKKEERKSA